MKTIEMYRDVALLRYVSSSSSISTTGLDLSGLVSKKEIMDMVRAAVELYHDTGLPAGFNALPTMVPRVEQNNVVLTHARTVARKAQGLHTTKGLQSDRNVVDFTDASQSKERKSLSLHQARSYYGCQHSPEKKTAGYQRSNG